MPLLDKTPAYTTLEMALLNGMNNSSALTFSEANLTPSVYKNDGTSYQNVHTIPLEADLMTWNNGAWFILKPRFFNQIINNSKRTELNVLVTSLLGLDNTVNINNTVLSDALIQNTDNDIIFDVFVMMKIMIEKLELVSPKRARNFEYYQAISPLRRLNKHEQELAVSLWPGIKYKTMWQKSLEQDLESTVGIVFGCLQEVIAQVAINSSLQSIALKVGLEHKNLVNEKDLIKSGGLCDLTSKDLDTMTDFLCSLPQTKAVYDWLVKHDSQLTRTLSQLLGAILEKPQNVKNFLQALNLQQGSAKSILDKIEREKISKEQLIKENKNFSDKINVLLTELSKKINSSGQAKYIDATTSLQQQLERYLDQLRKTEINRETFMDHAILVIQHIQPIFREEPKWYDFFTDFLKKILNFFIEFVSSPKENPHKFFKLINEEANDIIKFESSLKTA
jgi:hypothetical protein